MYKFQLTKSADLSRNRLIWVAILIGRESLCVRMAKLAACTCTPGIKLARAKNCDSVRFAARNFFDFVTLQVLDHLWFRLIGTTILVFRHTLSVWVAQLATTTAAPRVETALLCKSYRVSISTSDLCYLDALEKFNQSRSRLIRIPLDISGQVAHRL